MAWVAGLQRLARSSDGASRRGIGLDRRAPYHTGPTGAYLRRPTYLALQRPDRVRWRVIWQRREVVWPRERAYPGGTSEFLVAATLDSAIALMRCTVSFTP